MGKEIELFKSEERKDLASVAAFLHQLADKLAKNQVILRQGAEEIVVNIPNNVVLELKVEEEDKKGKVKRTLEVEIEWLEGDESGGVVTLG
jgi:amphi-Trp domain-containing protein